MFCMNFCSLGFHLNKPSKYWFYSVKKSDVVLSAKNQIMTSLMNKQVRFHYKSSRVLPKETKNESFSFIHVIFSHRRWFVKCWWTIRLVINKFSLKKKVLENALENSEMRNIWIDALSESDPDYVEMIADSFLKHE